MLTLYHAPNSRSSRIVTLIDEMGIADKVTIRVVDIHRWMSGTSARDPNNPHPEGKVPYLVDGETGIREGIAIMLYLTEKFPEGGMGVPPGDPDRGAFLAWMSYYALVVEPVTIFAKTGISHPFLPENYRGMDEVMASFRRALDKGPWLMGERYTAADLVMSSVFTWYPEALPDDAAIRDWAARCQARPAHARTLARDAEAMAEFA